MMKTAILFTRHEKCQLSTYGILEISHDQNSNSNVLIEKLKSAVTKWIKETPQGKIAWNHSCNDLNVGDLASYENEPTLAPYLKEQGIQLKFLSMNDDANHFDFDLVLANYEEITTNEVR
ncbi:hypothetical protein ACP3V3_01930 [Vibrio sp. PNB22_3_1]